MKLMRKRFMKKISKAIVKFIKSCIKFVDRWIITPITKFFVNIIDLFSNRSTRFEKVLTNRQSLIIISLIFALITFYAIDKKHISLIDNSAEVLYNQKVNVNYNEALYVVEGVPDEVDVTLVGRKMDVYLAKQYPLNGVTLDLTGYTPGNYSVGFKYEQAVSSVEYKVDPSSVNIRIYDKISITKEVSSDVIHRDDLDSKLNIDSIVLDRDDVIVKGASHRLEKVASVKAIVDINKMTNIKEGTLTMEEIPLIAYDDEGNKIDVEIVPANVNATIKISSPKKEIPVVLSIEGELDGVAIKKITPSVEKVTVYGKQEAIDAIDSLPVSVDVTGLKEDKSYSINLVKPTGIREISSKTITVKVEVGEIVSKDFENIPINAENIPEGCSVQVVGEQNRTSTIIVNGSKEAVDSIEPSTIYAYLDLKGLAVGEQTVEVKAKGDNKTVIYTPRVKEIKVRITKIG
jgi:YbbR domain-containing protein